MKLRNKKTGDAVYVDFQIPLCNNNKALGSYSVTSLKALNESFEDYTPAEPLIKDEKIRKAVRAWAEANDMTCCHYECGEFEQEYSEICAGISFGEQTDYLEERHYTITELCGEEEE